MTDEKTKLTISRKVCIQSVSMQYTLLKIRTIHIYHAYLPTVIGFIVNQILIDLQMFFMQHFQKLLFLLFKHDILIMCDRFFESKIRDLT